MSHPDALPDLFLDRSLGRIRVPEILRAAGLRLTTLAEHYGVPEDERVADADWLTLAGQRGLGRLHEGRPDPLPTGRASRRQGTRSALLLPDPPGASG